MADHMDDIGFWLPSDFLSDDLPPENDGVGGGGGGTWFPSEFPYCGSGLCSPEESVLGSTEAESDEEDLAVAGVARRLATKNKPMSSSPQSTLRSAGEDDGWDLISAAAGEVMRMKLKQERGLLSPPKPAASTGYFFNPALAQLHNAKSRGGRQGGGCKNSGNGRPVTSLLSPAWPPPPPPPPPQPTNSGMRAVFLGSSGTRGESAGTGVFLPRRRGTASDNRRKPTCSTVLIPARVVQALNLDMDEAGVTWPRLPPSSNPRPPARGNTHVPVPPRRSSAVRPAASMNPEYHLPPEWTY